MPLYNIIKHSIKLLFLILIAGCSSKKNSFEILYYSNLNGNIEACECYDVMLGGLHQIKPLVDTMRQQNADLVLVDGGDTFNSYPFIELDQAISQAYKLIKPDIWIPGEQELIEGDVFFNSLVDSLPGTFISGNLQINNTVTETHKIYTFQNRKIIFTSYIQPDLFKGLDPEPRIAEKSQNLTQHVADNAFNILVFHGDEKEYNKNKSMISSFDLVLTAHQQSPLISLEGETALVGGGADGEFLVHIILQENDSGFKISASKINIEQKENPNKQIVKIISDYRDAIGLNE